MRSTCGRVTCSTWTSGRAVTCSRNYASFDTDTRGPPQMPAGYDPQQIMELGKNPGLGVRALHLEGITGRGIHVAFIDQPLLLDHAAYKGRLPRAQIDTAELTGGD